MKKKKEFRGFRLNDNANKLLSVLKNSHVINLPSPKGISDELDILKHVWHDYMCGFQNYFGYVCTPQGNVWSTDYFHYWFDKGYPDFDYVGNSLVGRYDSEEVKRITGCTLVLNFMGIEKEYAYV